jgi:transposase
MKTHRPKIIELSVGEWEEILQHAESGPLSEAERETLKAMGETYLHLLTLLEDRRTTIDRLRKIVFGSSSEKTKDLFDKIQAAGEASGGHEAAPTAGAAQAQESDQAQASDPAPASEPAKRKGHGRNGADAYPGAERVRVPHESLKPGDPCPACTNGTIYPSVPAVLVRIVGRAPVQATVYEQQRLRCNLCGKVFTAALPEGVDTEKYDATSASMIALLKYGSGLPFHRLEGLQGNVGIPLPASTQWDIVNEAAEKIAPVYAELVRQAAQGEVLYNDDTTMKILDLMGKRAKARAFAEAATACAEGAPVDAQDTSARREKSPSPKDRTGIYTSGLVSTGEGRTIALFFTGRRHAGENLADVLRHRAEELSLPIQMCDGLSRNLPEGFKTILANCNAHSRRKFVDVAANFPEACLHVLDILGKVYANDALAGERNLSPKERLAFHQAESRPLLDELQGWLTQQFDERLVEPNSGLGEAMTYMLKHWDKLTLFLREPGAPLDNNICERALKRAILHRKNAMFYKTEHGAWVGDLYMSLIHTCQLCGANPFDYLTELGNHADELSQDPPHWMPWNYRATLAAAVPANPSHVA